MRNRNNLKKSIFRSIPNQQYKSVSEFQQALFEYQFVEYTNLVNEKKHSSSYHVAMLRRIIELSQYSKGMDRSEILIKINRIYQNGCGEQKPEELLAFKKKHLLALATWRLAEAVYLEYEECFKKDKSLLNEENYLIILDLLCESEPDDEIEAVNLTQYNDMCSERLIKVYSSAKTIVIKNTIFHRDVMGKAVKLNNYKLITLVQKTINSPIIVDKVIDKKFQQYRSALSVVISFNDSQPAEEKISILESLESQKAMFATFLDHIAKAPDDFAERENLKTYFSNALKLSGDKNYELFMITIKSAGYCGMPAFALEVYESAKIEGFSDDLRLFSFVIEALGVVGYYNQLEQIYYTALNRILEQEQEKIDELEVLEKSREEIEIELSEYYFNHIHPIHVAAIKSMGKCGQHQAAIHIYKSLCEYWNGVYVDSEIYLNMIWVCIYNDDFFTALEIYKDMLSSDYRSSIDVHVMMMTEVALKNKRNVLELISIIAREILKEDGIVLNIVNFFLEEAYEIVKNNENFDKKSLPIDAPLSLRILQARFSSPETKASTPDETYHLHYAPQRRESVGSRSDLMGFDAGDEGDLQEIEDDDNEEVESDVDSNSEYMSQQSHFSSTASTLFHQGAPTILHISISPPTSPSKGRFSASSDLS